MAVYKEEKTNTWWAVYRYTDWNGERKQTQKRGFKTKREAQGTGTFCWQHYGNKKSDSLYYLNNEKNTNTLS